MSHPSRGVAEQRRVGEGWRAVVAVRVRRPPAQSWTMTHDWAVASPQCRIRCGSEDAVVVSAASETLSGEGCVVSEGALQGARESGRELGMAQLDVPGFRVQEALVLEARMLGEEGRDEGVEGQVGEGEDGDNGLAEVFVIERGAQACDHCGSVASAGRASAGEFFLRWVTRSAATCWR